MQYRTSFSHHTRNGHERSPVNTQDPQNMQLSYTVSELLPMFIHDYLGNEKQYSQSTLDNYERYMKKFIMCTGDMAVGQIKRFQVSTYRNFLLNR